MTLDIRVDDLPHPRAFAALWEAAWGFPYGGHIAKVLSHSLVYLCAYDGSRLVGFVNVAWDGGSHAFLLDPMVHPDHRHKGLGTNLVKRAIALSRERGAAWLHVDYEPHLDGFYRACGFRPTAAGLIALEP